MKTKHATPSGPQKRSGGSNLSDPAIPARRGSGFVGPAVLIVVLTLVSYGRSLGNGYIWDDPDYVINNPTLRDLSGLWEMWTSLTALPQWYPLVHTTFWVEYHLWDLWWPGYHIVNTLLHAANAILVWRLLKRLDVPGAWLAGAIFAVHPVMVESVAWVTERKNVLSCFFYLSAAIVYLQSRREDRVGEVSAVADRRLYALALVLFLCALFSKTVTSSLPAAILVLIWWKHGRIRRQDVIPLIPFFVLGVLMGSITAYLERNHVGANTEFVPELALSPIQRILIAGRVVWFYAGKFVWPTDLFFIYPRWTVDPHVLWQWAFPAAVVVTLVVLLLLRNRIGRAPLATALLFVGTLFPALGFFNVYPMRFSYVADHFQYHASISLIAGLSAGIVLLLGRLGLTERSVCRLAAPLLVVLAVLTFGQTDRYLNAETLWRTTAAENPNSWLVWTGLGNALVQQERYDEATPYFEKALELGPHVQDTWWNVGNVRMRQNKVDDAEMMFRKSVELTPQFAAGWDSLGKLYYFRKKDVPQAEAFYRKALEITHGTFAETHFNLAVLLDQTGRTQEALEHYRSAIAHRADYVDAHEYLAALLLKLKQFDEAIYNLNHVVRIQPDNFDARLNLGWALLFTDRRGPAAEQFRIALEQRPGDPRAEKGLRSATGSPS